MTPVRFHREARAELDAAAIWYDERRPGQGAVLLGRVRDVLGWIQAAPNGGTTWGQRGARTWRLVRFPFLVIYVVEPDHLLVLAFAHTKRRPGYWEARLLSR